MITDNKVSIEALERLRNNQSYIKVIIDKINFLNNKVAKEILNELIIFSKENNLDYVYSWTLYKLGRIYVVEDSYQKANELFNEVYEIFHKNNNINGMISVIAGFIASECMQHKYTSAIQWGIKGIRLAEEANNIELLIIIKGNLAGVYIVIEEYEKAIEILEQIEQIPWIGTDVNKIDIYLNRAICEQRINNLDKALYYIDYIEEIALQHPHYALNWLLEKAKIYIKKGLTKEAEEMLLEVIRKRQEIEEVEIDSESLIYLSKIDVINEKYQLAIERLNSIEEKVLKDRDLTNIRDMYNIYNLAHKGLKQYENAYFYLEKWLEIEKELREIQEETIFTVLDEQKKNMLDKNYKMLYEQNQLIYKVGQNIISNLNKKNIFKVIAEEIKNIIKYDIIEIVVYNEKTKTYQYQLVIQEDKIINFNSVDIYDYGFASYSINHKEDILINDIENQYHRYIDDHDKYFNYINEECNWRSGKLTESLMFVPMIIKDKVVGNLCVQKYEKNAFDLKDLSTLKILSTYIAIALDNSSLYKKVQYNANYDSLTDIYNRRKVIENINKLRERVDYEREEYYIAMMDIDNFKKINDVYGHGIGDKVLVEIASIIRKLIGPDDIVGRYGGEEFVIIIKNQNNNFKNTIESFRRGIEDLRIKINDNKYINITTSIGVAKFDIKSMTLEENIALADKSLYKAKNLGKNIVVYW
ncbi:GGDEF domain-containing protein [Clostridium sp. 1001271B_151109_B4]|uniref:sensor domain-containing diguanylate cyclase n=1 Tax=Clostridium sp. 1001271B_151109_B4 TaxID=2787148 RepID=UPI0018A9172E|nr:GGDEF domain-containing protein [Clostridium sp. 1001271B_151109_B4]